jgi:hypothetical protein
VSVPLFFATTFDKFPQTLRLNTIGAGGTVKSITVAGSFAISSALGSYSSARSRSSCRKRRRCSCETRAECRPLSCRERMFLADPRQGRPRKAEGSGVRRAPNRSTRVSCDRLLLAQRAGRARRGTPANLDFRAMMPKISMVVPSLTRRRMSLHCWQRFAQSVTRSGNPMRRSSSNDGSKDATGQRLDEAAIGLARRCIRKESHGGPQILEILRCCH